MGISLLSPPAKNSFKLRTTFNQKSLKLRWQTRDVLVFRVWYGIYPRHH